MDNIRLIALLPAPPEQVYDTWLSSPGHASMTGSPATSEPHIGGRHTAWDGYISGRARRARARPAYSSNVAYDGVP